jgi:hypothetical protein
MKVDCAAESKSPYENYFDPSSSFNSCVAVSVRCRSASSARNLHHFRKRRVPKRQYAQLLSRYSSFLSGSVDDLAFQDVSLHRQVSIIYTPNGPLIYRWERNTGEPREAAGR